MDPLYCMKDRILIPSHVGEHRICSVSTAFAQFPSSSMPLRRYRSPDLLADRRDISVNRNVCEQFPGDAGSVSGDAAFVASTASSSSTTRVSLCSHFTTNERWPMKPCMIGSRNDGDDVNSVAKFLFQK